jgi:putative acetyltransferase
MESRWRRICSARFATMPDEISTLSMVAERDDEIIGHVVCTRGRVGILDALGLGPISILPIRQRQGAGETLMHAVIGAADAAGEPLIALRGDPRFYIRFGFVPTSELGVDAPDPAWAEHFQVRTVTDCPPLVAGAFDTQHHSQTSSGRDPREGSVWASAASTDDGHQPGGPWWVGALLLRHIRVREQEPSVRGCQGDKPAVSLWPRAPLLASHEGSDGAACCDGLA